MRKVTRGSSIAVVLVGAGIALLARTVAAPRHHAHHDDQHDDDGPVPNAPLTGLPDPGGRLADAVRR